MLLAKNDRLVMIGDSITDCERRRPIGEGRLGSLGQGYVSMVDALLQTMYPELAIRVTNMGISGDNVRNLAERWQTDVMDLEPNWLSIKIGINDVWSQYVAPYYTERHVYIEEYERTLRDLIAQAQTLPSLKGIILVSPYYIESNPQDATRQAMDQYGQVVKKIAEELNLVFVDTQAAFAGVLEHMYPGALAWDRVHPSAPGHMVIARAFLQEIGFEWK
ncbi:GDSL family lipase [Paenibacillus albiflavus]|uniref:GDSL family lipase n=1 Tax=Paenibacillus albiflavus TaxID=2545760 RepID=A0A4R4DY14_9BACL|nr:SGNH/GDSL hydrolase family protein [Paenibacillus albiflavus]TCZ70209.1 GDSL family lipase [Paenibacillus albiflavus]